MDPVDEEGSVALPFLVRSRLEMEDEPMKQVLEQRPAQDAEQEQTREADGRDRRILRTFDEQPGDDRPPAEPHVPGTHPREILLNPVDGEHARAAPARTIELRVGA